ncbi:hypothetical protein Cgig2_013072 [Carnegiea gigantea]|uniref:GPN-loop GTPase 3 n=1 Tax=Carnegiea gigantea TaxID=171969 RepID=A0A9Q1KQL3_9CARY|nr:hypothetical protein Cgig2_013072 [Carnegiea gigantea]
MGYAQLVIGPAGSGKSTYCSSLYQHCETTRRNINVVNLDPAAENFDYPVAVDIREFISLEDVMEELGLGPNGALIYCMEQLEDNLDDWLTEQLDDFREDDYLFEKLNKALIDLIDEFSMVSFIPLDLRKERSIQYVLSQIDLAIQYGEDADVKVKDFDFDPEGDD